MSRGRSNAIENAPPARFSEADESTPWGLGRDVASACDAFLLRRGLNKLCACGHILPRYGYRECKECRVKAGRGTP